MTIANDPLLDIHNHLTNNEFEIWLEGNNILWYKDKQYKIVKNLGCLGSWSRVMILEDYNKNFLLLKCMREKYIGYRRFENEIYVQSIAAKHGYAPHIFECGLNTPFHNAPNGFILMEYIPCDTVITENEQNDILTKLNKINIFPQDISTEHVRCRKDGSLVWIDYDIGEYGTLLNYIKSN